MEMETIITIVTAAATLVGSGALFMVRIRSAAKEARILKEETKKETDLRKKEERDKFYLLTASNLVLSAERLNLTGPQKKEYVMTWLENEAIKAGVVVDKAVMSVAIERVVLLMNDHRHTDAPFVGLLDGDLAAQTAREQERIKAETEKALMVSEEEAAKTAELINEGEDLATSSLADVKALLSKTSRKSIK